MTKLRTTTAMAAAVLTMTACASSQEAIEKEAASASTFSWQGQSAVRDGNFVAAMNNFQAAEAAYDPSSEPYLDGRLYVDRATHIGNQAMIKLRGGEGYEAKQLFDKSAEVFTSGVNEHIALENSRAEDRATAVSIVGFGLGALAAVAAIDAAGSATTQVELDSISASLNDTLTTIGDATVSMAEMVGTPTDLDINNEAKDVEADYFRAAVISDDPIIAATTRVQTRARGGGVSGCTGFYVSPHLVVTAGHCFDAASGEVGVQSAAMNDSAAFLDPKATRLGSAPRRASAYDDDKPFGRRKDAAILYSEVPSRDWLDLSLEDPAGTEGAGMVIGYSGDLDGGYFLRLDYGCDFFKAKSPQDHKTNCTLWRGNSGGPVFVDHGPNAEQQFSVVGIAAYFQPDEFRSDRSNVNVHSTKIELIEPLLRRIVKSRIWPKVAKTEAEDLLGRYFAEVTEDPSPTPEPEVTPEVTPDAVPDATSDDVASLILAQ